MKIEQWSKVQQFNYQLHHHQHQLPVTIYRTDFDIKTFIMQERKQQQKISLCQSKNGVVSLCQTTIRLVSLCQSKNGVISLCRTKIRLISLCQSKNGINSLCQGKQMLVSFLRSKNNYVFLSRKQCRWSQFMVSIAMHHISTTTKGLIKLKRQTSQDQWHVVYIHHPR